MEDKKYFKEALSAMVAQSAYVDAIRHLHDSGLTVEEIQKNLDYPASVETIESVIDKYEAEKNRADADYKIVQITDEYGRKSFIKVKK
ncbi:MAG: hypothetical protein HUJ70_13700 [Pseudobutyrivibrio sp.]|nr:hypothetical protein [Pseudobutyrivibrio sp.]